MSAAQLERWVPGMVGLLVFGIPTGWLWLLLITAWRARGWPTAPGRVTSSSVVARRRGAADYQVRYEYQVDGEGYRGERVRFGGALNSNAGDAEATRATYPVGRTVQVRYDPLRPGRSTLEVRPSRALWLWAWFGLFMVCTIGGALLGLWG